MSVKPNKAIVSYCGGQILVGWWEDIDLDDFATRCATAIDLHLEDLRLKLRREVDEVMVPQLRHERANNIAPT